MITSDAEEIFPSKQQAHGIKIDKPSPSSTPWLRLKDPRIVRVSRAFGGKDRHSKVCTIRGLRDRRVRLSVPTAIQLYDLQDRLGLNQPSKVVDWLLHAAKDEIDELPPLPIQPEFFGQNYQSMLELVSPGAFQSNGELKISNGMANEDASSGLIRPSNFISDVLWRDKVKEVEKEDENQRENWRKSFKKHSNGSEKQFLLDNQSLLGTLNNNSNSYVHQLEASNLSSSHLGSHLSTQAEHHLHNFNFMQLPPPFSLPTGSQIFICPTGSQSYIPSSPFESDPRQANHFPMMSSTSQSLFTNSLTPSQYPNSHSIRPFPFSMAPKLFPSPENSDGRPK